MSNAANVSKLGALAAHVANLIGISSNNAGVPTGAVFDWALNNAPTGYILCDGSTLLSNTPHTNLRAALIADGFPHGNDGSGNPKLPDAKGRVTAGKDNMGGTAAGRLTTAVGGVDGATLGAAGGNATHTLTASQLPTITSSGTFSLSDSSLVKSGSGTTSFSTGSGGGTIWQAFPNGSSQSLVSPNASGSTSSTNTGGQAHNNTQPTLVLNKIIKT